MSVLTDDLLASFDASTADASTAVTMDMARLAKQHPERTAFLEGAIALAGATMMARVLVIEDEVDLATTLEYNLKSEGFQVQVAYTGRQGLVAASTDPLPDVVVLDLMLPDVAGTEICRRLREQETSG